MDVNLWSDMNFAGINIQTNIMLVDDIQFRFPTSKKKRIRKKWRKNKNNWKSIPSKRILYFKETHTIICHPHFLPSIHKMVKDLNL